MDVFLDFEAAWRASACLRIEEMEYVRMIRGAMTSGTENTNVDGETLRRGAAMAATGVAVLTSFVDLREAATVVSLVRAARKYEQVTAEESAM